MIRSSIVRKGYQGFRDRARRVASPVHSEVIDYIGSGDNEGREGRVPEVEQAAWQPDRRANTVNRFRITPDGNGPGHRLHVHTAQDIVDQLVARRCTARVYPVPLSTLRTAVGVAQGPRRCLRTRLDADQDGAPVGGR